MKRIIVIFLIALASVGLFAKKSAYRLNVQDFCELTVVDGVRVEYISRADSTGWAIFECDEDIASKIMFTNNVQRLTIQTAADGEPIVGVPLVKLYSSTLRRIENSGDSLLTAYMNVPVERLSIVQIDNGTIVANNVEADELTANLAAGKGHISINGKSKKVKLTNVSGGDIDAEKLDTPLARCYVFGKGNIYVSPREQLKIYGAGSGKIYYTTEPKKKTSRSIGVKAQKRE